MNKLVRSLAVSTSSANCWLQYFEELGTRKQEPGALSAHARPEQLARADALTVQIQQALSIRLHHAGFTDVVYPKPRMTGFGTKNLPAFQRKKYKRFDAGYPYCPLSHARLTFEEQRDTISRPCIAKKLLPGATNAWLSGAIAAATPTTQTLTHAGVMFRRVDDIF